MDTYIDELVAVTQRFNENESTKRAYSFLRTTFKNLPHEVVINVSQNIKLFRLFQTADCDKFVNIDDAMTSLNISDESRKKTLIHFTELGLYGMFSPEQYAAFAGNLLEKVYEGANISFRPKQIVLAGLPQKLVFICLGDEQIVEKIRQYVAEKYKCEITYVKTDDRVEITVQGMGGNNYIEAQKTFHDLINFIETKKDYTTAGKLLPMRITTGKEPYMIANLSYDITKPCDLKNIVEMFKTLHGENVVVNLVIINGNNHGQINFGGAQINNANVSKTMEWVKNNPPHEREITTVYYKRYIAGCDEKLSDNKFGKIVRKYGYITNQGTKGRQWIQSK